METTEKTTAPARHGAGDTEPDFGQLMRKARHGDGKALHCLLRRTDAIARSLARKECFYRAWGAADSYGIARAGLLQFLFTFKGDIRNRTFYGLVRTCLSRYLISQLRKDGKTRRKRSCSAGNKKKSSGRRSAACPRKNSGSSCSTTATA